ncbi:MAG: hypothetical protein OZ934_07425 [Anaerolineae bacterium]|nr:hypothetical protein [Anaerolineae bacterium]
MAGHRWHVARLALIIGLAALLVGVAPAPAARAQTDMDTVRAVVQSWLLQTLGKPGLILVEYTFSSTSWPDSSLGCPTPGQAITPGVVHGYRWNFTFDNMVRYEVHSGLGGAPAVLCGSVNIAPEVRMSTYAGRDFSILVPDSWLVFSTGSDAETLFAPGPSTDCALPGMVVTALGRVAAGVTPDQLLDDYLAGAGRSDAPTSRQPAGTAGRSTRYETPCDGGTRGWRVSAFVQLGSAYRVLQWAPGAEFDQWNIRFENMLSQFSPAGATVPAEGSGDAAAAERSALPLALHFAGDVFLGALNDVPGRGLTTVPTFDRRYVGFAPNGLLLAYVDASNSELRTMDTAAGLSPRRVAQKVDARFPAAWSADSARIAYVSSNGAQQGADGALLAIDAVPALGGDAERLATFAFSDDCALPSADPADEVTATEAGPGDGAAVLAWLPDGRFVVSTRCAGGLTLLAPATGEAQPLDADLRGAVMAPDGARLAARTDVGIAVLDLASGERDDLPADSAVRALAWTADGTAILYATETLVDRVALDDPAERAEAEAAFGRWPVEVGVYDLALVRLDVASGAQTLIWRGQGRAVGRIAPAPDGSGVLFSVVPSGLALVEAFRAGGDALALRATQPQPALYWLAEGAPSAVLLAYAGQPAFAPVTVTAPTP